MRNPTLTKIIKNNGFLFGKLIALRDKSNSLIIDILSEDTGEILFDLERNRRLMFSIPNNVLGRITSNHNKYYEFQVYYDNQDRKYYIIIKSLRLINDPYKAIVKKRFNANDNPESNRTIASLLDEVGKNMYRSKKRMFFELLQNADDMPVSENGNVSFFVESIDDYLVVKHNGLPFNKDDVNSITTAAQSTKLRNKKKTGYKGIGFKSVFSDSTQVIINSGGFSFEFNKENPIFSDFYKLYIKGTIRDKYLDAKEEFIDNIGGIKPEYTQIKYIPWQIKPFWLNVLPTALFKNRFTSSKKIRNENNSSVITNVAIALKYNEKTIEYINIVEEIIKDGRFLLFLRAVDYMEIKNKIWVRKIVEGDKVIIDKKNGAPLTYIIREYDDIDISESEFENAQVDLKIGTRDESGEQVRFFISKTGKEWDGIPPKIAAFDKTSIHFATNFDYAKHKITKEKGFVSDGNYNCFFTFLPMNEPRIKFPFLVNADFIPSSNREEIQGDNPWNLYLFFKIGQRFVEWLTELSELYPESYLELLLHQELIAKTADVKELTDKFNEGFNKGLENVSFILDNKEKLVNISELIIDDSGLRNIFNDEELSDIYPEETNLNLIKKGISFGYMNKPFYIGKGVVFRDIIFVRNKFNNRNYQIGIENLLQTKNDQEYKYFLKWMNDKLISNNPSLFVDERKNKISLNDFQFIKYENQFYSVNQFLQSKGVILNTNKTNAITGVLSVMGISSTEINFSDYPNILSRLDKTNSYLENGIELFNLINDGTKKSALSYEQKKTLITFINSLPGLNTRHHFSIFKIYKSNIGDELFAASKLLSNSTAEKYPFLHSFCIAKDEESLIEEGRLINFDNLFSDFFAAENTFPALLQKIDQNNLILFYKSIIESYTQDENAKENKSKLSTKNLVCTDINGQGKLSYSLPENIYFDPRFVNMPKSDYTSLKSIITGLTGLVLPVHEALSFLNSLKFTTQKGALTDFIKHNVNLSEDAFKDWTSYLVDSNFGENIFDKVNVSISEASSLGEQKKIEVFISSKIQYSSDINLDVFIENNDLSGSYTSTKGLENIVPSASLKKLGLFSAVEILNDIIDSRVSINLSLCSTLTEIGTLSMFKKFTEYISSIPIQHTDELPEDVISFFQLLDKYVKNDPNHESWFSSIRNKIKVNGNTIDGTELLDTVTFNYATGNSKKIVLSRKKILNTPESSTVLTEIQNILIEKGIPKRDVLNKVFSLKEDKHESIRDLLIQNYKKELNEEQLKFILAYTLENSGEVDSFADNYFEEILKDETQLLYTNLAYKNDIKTNNTLFGFISFNSKVLLEEQHLYLESQKLPEKINAWRLQDSTGNRTEWLKFLGLNTQGGNLYKIRTAIYTNEKIEKEWMNSSYSSGTLRWILDKGKGTTSSLSDIDKYNISLLFEPSKFSQRTYVPILKINEDHIGTYIVRRVPIGIEEATKFMFSSTIDNEEQIVILRYIEENTPEHEVIDRYYTDMGLFNDLVIQEITLEESFDTEKIASRNPIDYSNEDYDTWADKPSTQIILIDGEIPFVKKYEELEVNYFDSGTDYWDEDSETLYISKSVETEARAIIKRVLLLDSSIDSLNNHIIHSSENKNDKLKQLQAENESLKKAAYAPRDRSNITTSKDDVYTNEIRIKSEAHCEKYFQFLNKLVESMNPNGVESYKQYDFIENLEGGETKYYDCKGTVSNKSTFYMSRLEWDFFLENKERYSILRVTNVASLPSEDFSNIQEITLWNEITEGNVVPYLVAQEELAAHTVYLTNINKGSNKLIK